MRVKMLQDAPGSPDGVTVNDYTEGEAYSVRDELGEAFVKFGLAVEIDSANPAKGANPKPEPRGADTSKKASKPAENK